MPTQMVFKEIKVQEASPFSHSDLQQLQDLAARPPSEWKKADFVGLDNFLLHCGVPTAYLLDVLGISRYGMYARARELSFRFTSRVRNRNPATRKQLEDALADVYAHQSVLPPPATRVQVPSSHFAQAAEEEQAQGLTISIEGEGVSIRRTVHKDTDVEALSYLLHALLP